MEDNRPAFYLTGKVEDYMSEGAITVGEDLPLEDAVELFADHHFHGLPVVNKRDEVVGVLRDSDVLSMFARHDPAVAVARKVADIMFTPPLIIAPHDSAQKAVERMFAEQTRILAVVDRERKVVAVVTRTDLVKAIRKK
jgi:CBS domain-containing protein